MTKLGYTSPIMKYIKYILLITFVFSNTHAVFADYFVDFEDANGSSSNYAETITSLNGIEWYIGPSALVFNNDDAGDMKNGLRSARIRYKTKVDNILGNDIYGKLEMAADKTGGLGTISFKYARSNFLNDRTGTSPVFMVEYSIDTGATWTQTGSNTNTSGVDTLTTFTSAVNKAGDVRVRIVQIAGTNEKRWNVDDILLTDYELPITPTLAPDLTSATDSGRSNTDNIINQFPIDIYLVCNKAGSTLTVYSSGVSAGDTTCSSVGITGVTLTTLPTATDGDYSISYTEKDSVNESGHSPILLLTLDTLAPLAPTITTPSINRTISGTAEVDALVTISTPSGSNCSAIANASGNYSCQLSPNPVDGEDVSAKTTDVAGNDSPVTVEIAGISFIETTPDTKNKNSSIKYTCNDKLAKNYDRFGRHKQSLCKYSAPGNTTSTNLFNGKQCVAELILTQNLSAPSRNGYYSNYTKAIVKDAKILQQHMNRLGFNSGVEDGWIGPITKGAIKRMQIHLGTVADGYVGPLTRNLINTSC